MVGGRVKQMRASPLASLIPLVPNRCLGARAQPGKVPGSRAEGRSLLWGIYQRQQNIQSFQATLRWSQSCGPLNPRGPAGPTPILGGFTVPPGPAEVPNDAQKVLSLILHRRKQALLLGQGIGMGSRGPVTPAGFLWGLGGQGHKLGVPSLDGEEAPGSGEGSSDIALGHYALSTGNSASWSWAGWWQ